MTYSLNGQAVLSARVSLPRVGAWVADVETEPGAAPSGRVTLQLGALTLAGSVVRTGEFGARQHTRLVGGAGGLARVLDAKSYLDVPASVVLGDLLAEAGERLAPGADAAFASRRLAHWARARGATSVGLSMLAASLDAVWRVLADGTVWIGNESWPEASASHELLREWPACARAELWLEDLSSLAPGMSFLGRRVHSVEHVVEPDRIRTHVAWELSS